MTNGLFIRHRPGYVLVAGIFAACAGDARSSGDAVRDSAGVTIVEGAGPLWTHGQAWRLAERPSLIVGRDESRPEELFTSVRAAFRTADGGLIVANGYRPPELRVFDPDGDLMLKMGGEGDGPGEFRTIARAFRIPPDTLLVVDEAGRRFHYFDLEGEFLRVVTNEFNSAKQMADIRVVWDRFADGSFLTTPNSLCPFDSEGVGRCDVPWMRVDHEGVLIDTIAILPGVDYFRRGQSEGFVPFGRRTVARAHGTQLLVLEGDRYQVDIYDLDGNLRRVIRRERESRPVTAADREAFEQRQLEGARSEEHARIIRRRLRDAPPVEKMPPYDPYIRIDSDENLWIRDYVAPRDVGATWSVFDSEGRFLGTVPMPLAFMPVEIGSDYVLGVWRDELDVQTVRLFDLLKS